MKRNRFAIVLLSVVVILAALCGCGKKEAVPDPAFAALTGQWVHTDTGNAENSIITVNADGSFLIYDSVGGSRSGQIKIEEFEGGTVIKWYNFYDLDGTFLQGFHFDEEEPLNVIRAGNGATPSYVRFDASAALEALA